VAAAADGDLDDCGSEDGDGAEVNPATGQEYGNIDR
jgi:hypothetical protein